MRHTKFGLTIVLTVVEGGLMKPTVAPGRHLNLCGGSKPRGRG